ncbi:hypothetical protein D3874_00900 [Oleomonas cavernae]|uniref:DUF2946 domain-containing protein n=2 Tax=Oleomonas cavernae TaxID=2320859 RepID=A0A418WT87_9PROT|nr:hypothetical protein D3874_00900 [Oleomonas cavernae]
MGLVKALLLLAMLVLAAVPMPARALPAPVPPTAHAVLDQPAGAPCDEHGAPADLSCCLGNLCVMLCTALPGPSPVAQLLGAAAPVAYAGSHVGRAEGIDIAGLYRPPRPTV